MISTPKENVTTRTKFNNALHHEVCNINESLTSNNPFIRAMYSHTQYAVFRYRRIFQNSVDVQVSAHWTNVNSSTEETIKTLVFVTDSVSIARSYQQHMNDMTDPDTMFCVEEVPYLTNEISTRKANNNY